MICPECKIENQPDANFCFKCGHRFGGIRPTPGTAQVEDGAILQGNNNKTVGKDGILLDGNIGSDFVSGTKIKQEGG